MSICLWGPKKSGKTAFFTMLTSSAANVKPKYHYNADPNALKYQADMRRELYAEREFTTRTGILSKNHKYIFQCQADDKESEEWGLRAEVNFFDVSGEHFKRSALLLKTESKLTGEESTQLKVSTEFFKYLEKSKGILFCISPRDWDYDKDGNLTDNSSALLGTLNYLTDNNTHKINSDIALIFTMMDDPFIYAQIAGSVQDTDFEYCMRQHFKVGEVHTDRYKTYEKQLVTFARELFGEGIWAAINRSCHREKLRLFACAAFGIRREGDREDGNVIKNFNGSIPSASKLEKLPETEEALGKVIVWEPFRWLIIRNPDLRNRLGL